MNDSLSQMLTQLAGTLTVLARERDKLAATLTRLDTEVEQLRDEVFTLRSQLGMQAIPTCAPYSSLTSETREYVDTACAAFYLGRKAQTLRKWACYENGPVRPVRIHGRLAWSVADLRRVGVDSTCRSRQESGITDQGGSYGVRVYATARASTARKPGS
jgi:hypothetical protein